MNAIRAVETMFLLVVITVLVSAALSIRGRTNRERRTLVFLLFAVIVQVLAIAMMFSPI